MSRTAAALVIGNELLTGKVQEGNVAFLATELFALGIALRRVVLCADEIETIVADLDALRARHDFVFTSGGVGPTHDDITVPAVARAFGREVKRDPELERLIRGHYGERTTDGHLRMAELPEGAELISTERVRWPVIRIENVFVMPGVPEIFRMKFEAIKGTLGAGVPFVTRALYTRCDEGEIAALLERVEAASPGVRIGSYPRFGDPEYTVKLTFDGTDTEAVKAALKLTLEQIPAEKIVRAELG